MPGNVLLDRIPSISESHTIGTLAFGLDGTLLVGSGDAAHFVNPDFGGSEPAAFASASEAHQAGAYSALRRYSPVDDSGAYRAQDPRSLNGKILRIDPVDGSPVNGAQGVQNNPHSPLEFAHLSNELQYHVPAQEFAAFQADWEGAASRLYASGLRNPFRFSVRPGSGPSGGPGEVWIGDVGDRMWEEINVIRSGGENFGWPNYEGMDPHQVHGPGSTSFHEFQREGQNPLNHPEGGTISPAHSPLQLGDDTHDERHTLPEIGLRRGTSPAILGAGGEEFTNLSGNFPVDAIVGGVFSGTAADFPAMTYPERYQDNYFFGSYDQPWIKMYDPEARVLRDLATPADLSWERGSIAFARHPVTGEVYYLGTLGTDVYKIRYDGKRPVANVSLMPNELQSDSDIQASVDFTASDSYHVSNDPLEYSWSVVEVARSCYSSHGGALTDHAVHDYHSAFAQASPTATFDPNTLIGDPNFEALFACLGETDTRSFRFRVQLRVEVAADPSLYDTDHLDVWRGNLPAIIPIETSTDVLTGGPVPLSRVPDIVVTDLGNFQSDPLELGAGEPMSQLDPARLSEFQHDWRLDLFHWQNGSLHVHKGAAFCLDSEEFAISLGAGHGGGGDDVAYAATLFSRDLDGLWANFLDARLEEEGRGLRMTYLYDKGHENLFRDPTKAHQEHKHDMPGYFFVRPTSLPNEDDPFVAKGALTSGAEPRTYEGLNPQTTLNTAHFQIYTREFGIRIIDPEAPSFTITVEWEPGAPSEGETEALVWWKPNWGAEPIILCDAFADSADHGVVTVTTDPVTALHESPIIGVAANQDRDDIIQTLRVWIEPGLEP